MNRYVPAKNLPNKKAGKIPLLQTIYVDQAC